MSRTILERYWWAITIRGIVSVLFGLFVLFWTKDILQVLVLLFALFVTASGIVNIFASFAARDAHEHWWVYLVKGIFEVILGIIIFIYPLISIIAIVYLIALWALILGIIELWISSNILREVAQRWILTTTGIFSIIIAILLVVFPISSVVTVAWLIGLFALISGIAMLIFGLEVRR